LASSPVARPSVPHGTVFILFPLRPRESLITRVYFVRPIRFYLCLPPWA